MPLHYRAKGAWLKIAKAQAKVVIFALVQEMAAEQAVTVKAFDFHGVR